MRSCSVVIPLPLDSTTNMAAHQCFACKLPIDNDAQEYRLPCGEYRHAQSHPVETFELLTAARQAALDHYKTCPVCAPWSKRFDDASDAYWAARQRQAPDEELTALRAKCDAIDAEREQ
jgi:hypothetical protein